jgi:IS5 family transposase
VDSRTKLIHTVLASAANVADCLALQYLLHGKERRVWGDQAYRGQKAAIRAGAPRAKDFTNQRYRWDKRIDESVKATNRRKSSVRAKVEHVFGVIKRVFGFQKVCYRGLAKNSFGNSIGRTVAGWGSISEIWVKRLRGSLQARVANVPVQTLKAGSLLGQEVP